MSTIEDKLRQECTDWINRVADVTRAFGGPDTSDELRVALDAAYGDPRLRVVVCGEWNAGKSSLMNGLIGVPKLLPTSILTTTSYITEITAANADAFRVIRATAASPISRIEFQALTSESPYDATIDRIDVEAPVSWPTRDFLLVDTPGLEDLTKARAAVTLKYLPQADVIVLTADAIRGVTDSMKKFVRDVLSRNELSRVVCVLTHADRVDEQPARERRLTHCRETLASLLPHAPWLMSASPNHDGDALDQAQLAAIRSAIEGVMARERHALLLRRFRQPALRELNVLQTQLATEEAALTLPLAKAAELCDSYRREVRKVLAQNEGVLATATAQLNGKMDPWLRTIPDKVRGVRKRVQAEVEKLDDLDALRDFVNSDQLGRTLAAQLRTLTIELEEQLDTALREVSRDNLQGNLVSPVAVSFAPGALLPPVDSFFRQVPGFVLTAIEILLIDLIDPYTGLIAPVLERLGLGVLLKYLPGLGFLKEILPTGIARNQLLSAVNDSLDSFEHNTPENLQQTAGAVVDHLIADIKRHLAEQSDAVGRGLDDARVKLAQTQRDVDERRGVLGAARQALPGLAAELEALGH